MSAARMAASRRSTRAAATTILSGRIDCRPLRRARSLAGLPRHDRQGMIPAPDLLDDGVRVGGPHERLRVPLCSSR